MPDETTEPRERYHHGDLQRALIEAAEAILIERGVEGFTLREAARRAGVSAAAPAHHFGSAAGLLTEVALLGFETLTRFLRDGAAEGGTDPVARLHGQGRGYVRFARAHPARFLLMFRKDRLNWEDGRLRAAGQAAFAELEDVVRAYRGIAAGGPLDRAALTTVLACWSVVHGFAHLALDGKFDALGGAQEADAILPEMLAGLWPGPG
ncbi:TetR/AcrR family transcriptional regulator [Inquilinus sp.]|jgi:AcrR family transcriptional regulator|uniref:TetR/AcrR family transcriptional regulator n=1 Tax=Inquilinus sp. TaxID=1932117 RepID=UPI003782EA13